MKIDDIAETCELELKQSTQPLNDNDAMLNSIADKVENIVSAKLAEFEKMVNTADQQFNDNSDNNAVATENADNNASTNNDSANSSAESE